MARTKRGAAASTLVLIVMFVAACNRPFSTPPAGTPTSGASLFETPLTPDITMSEVANLGTGTALALSGTPQDIATQTPLVAGTQDLSATVTPTPLVTNPAGTVTTTLAVSGTLPTSAPVGSRPATYTLQRGEFPYCIARRFDVNPQELLSLNGLSAVQANSLAVGKVLSIPQRGSFPPPRALTAHPATYTVKSSSETIYSIACLYGDVDPAAIAQANNIAMGTALTSGQQLSIP